MKGKWKRKILAMMLALSITASGILGDGGICVKAQTQQADARGGNRVFCGLGYQIEMSESSGWEGGYVAEVVVTNTGKEAIRNWSVTAVMGGGEIEGAWNVSSQKTDTDRIVFESESHNMVIRPGASAGFGFHVTGGRIEDITSMQLVRGKMAGADEASAEFRETGSWDGHKTIECVITNHSGAPMRDWSISFEADGRITNIWNGTVVSSDGGSFHIGNCDYNAVIGAGQSVTFGFEVEHGTQPFRDITNARIYAGEDVSAEQTAKPPKTERPGVTGTPNPSSAPSVIETEEPETEEPEEEDDSGDGVEFVQVENRDWNMDMIRANDSEVEKAKENTGRKIRVTMLDSGINFSSEVDVKERKNFVEGEDELSYLFEDRSGHGTAIAEVLASDPEAAREEEGAGSDVDEEFGEYTYYGDNRADREESEDAQEALGNTISLGDLLDSGYEWTEGVNPNIELYSGKILDADNETTVDRAVRGIEWAIENDTDILSLSIGMDKDSERLHKAVRKAAASGILMIAAVGDDETVDYPAAYPEVMAVGMVNSVGETTGTRSEVVAPGESVVSRGVFDSMQLFTGSSMAVPHVAGLASILWQQDPSKPAAFIRGLIDVSANPVEGDRSCQYGLIDCKYALESYKAFGEQVRENDGILSDIARGRNEEEVKEEVAGEIGNDSEVETEEELERLHGNWGTGQHEAFVSEWGDKLSPNAKGNLKKTLDQYIEVLSIGTTFVDSEKYNPECQGMHDHPWFHGFYGGVEHEENGKKVTGQRSNYMTSVRRLVELADGMRESGTVKKVKPEDGAPKAVRNAVSGVQGAFDTEKDMVGSQAWENISPLCAKGKAGWKKRRSLLIYGMAMHTVGDTFSHSSYGMDQGTGKQKGKMVWKRFKHAGSKDGKWYADNEKSRKLRFESAKNAVQRALRQILLDKETGKLEGYGNQGSELDIYYADQFKDLKKYSVNFKKKLDKGRRLKKLAYFKEGFALKDFSKYYKQEIRRGAKPSVAIGKYKSYVDKKAVEKVTSKGVVVKISDEIISGVTSEGGKLELRAGGMTLMSLKPVGDSAAFVLFKDTSYEIVRTGLGRNDTVYTFRNGEMYDSIGRRMKLTVPDGADGEEEPDEKENMIVCDLVEYGPSIDCLVTGKVVYFDYKSVTIRDKQPGLAGVDIRATSRETGLEYGTVTEQDGTYQLWLPGGVYDITYSKGDGYTRVNQSVAVEGEEYSNLVVEMIDETWFGDGWMEGRVYDEATNVPLAGVTVKFYSGIGSCEGEPATTLTTNGEGYFTTDDLPAGAYTFIISADGYVTQSYYESIIGGVTSTTPKVKLRKEL